MSNFKHLMLALALVAPGSHAGMVTLTTADAGIEVGDIFSVDAKVDVSTQTGFDPVLAGGLDFLFNQQGSVASFQSFAFNPALFPSLLDPTLSNVGQLSGDRYIDVGFAEFFNGIDARFTLGTFTFMALSAGTFDITSAANASGLVGPFISFRTFSPVSNVGFGGLTLDIAAVSPVEPGDTPMPIPGTFWLLALPLLAMYARRERSVGSFAA